MVLAPDVGSGRCWWRKAPSRDGECSGKRVRPVQVEAKKSHTQVCVLSVPWGTTEVLREMHKINMVLAPERGGCPTQLARHRCRGGVEG